MAQSQTQDIAAMALSAEVAADCLANRAHGVPLVTMSHDEAATMAIRLYQLAAVARVHHAALLAGRC